MNEGITRRRFLRQSAFGVVALSAARVIPVFASSPLLSPEIENRLQFFSADEYLIMKAVSDRLIGTSSDGGPSPEQAGAALRADKFLAGSDPEIQGQFHQLLTVFNAPFFTFLFDFRFSSFVNMKPQDQDSYLEDSMTSIIGFRRTGFQALKRTSMSMFYTNEQTWKEIGFAGMDTPRN